MPLRIFCMKYWARSESLKKIYAHYSYDVGRSHRQLLIHHMRNMDMDFRTVCKVCVGINRQVQERAIKEGHCLSTLMKFENTLLVKPVQQGLFLVNM
jgi:hypothetical protein